MKRGTQCAAHTHDSAVPQEDHHVWPLGYHGPDVATNKVRICCNAHSDAHYYLEYLLRHNGQRPENWRTWGAGVRAIAMRGYDQVMAYGEWLSS